MENRFWTEGTERLQRALGERRAEVDELIATIQGTKDHTEKRRLEQKLRDLLAEYDPTEEEIEHSLFFAR